MNCLYVCPKVTSLSCFVFTLCACMETFDTHELILSVSEDFLSELLCIHNVYIETFGLHGQILCVSEDFLSE